MGTKSMINSAPSSKLKITVTTPSKDGTSEEKTTFEAHDAEMGPSHIAYTTARGREKLDLIKVTALAGMLNDPKAWTVFINDGSTYQLSVESSDARQAWVDGILERLRHQDETDAPDA